MRRTAAVRLGAAVLAAAAILAACGGGDDSKAVNSGNDKSSTTTAAAGGSGTTSASTGASTGASGTGCTLVGAATTTQSTAATPTPSLLTDLTSAVHDGCDRVVFQFRADTGVPGYQVEYRPGPFNKGESNEPLEVQGAAYLVVRFDKASGVDLTTPNAMPTYTGPRTILPSGLNHVVEIVNSEDFEGVLTWVVGLDSQRPFKVTTLSSPPRVVVDIS